MQSLRGALFYAVIYPLMGVVGALMFPAAALSQRFTRWGCKQYFRAVFLFLRLIGGVRVAVRGEVPTGDVLVAAKHQSMLDVFLLYVALPRALFVMKRELTRTPVFGWYALRVGAVPVDRGGGQPAMQAMVDRLKADARGGDQMVIYPQGTRTPPGVRNPYKAGVFALYEATGRPCVPVATNSGAHWPRGLRLHPGLAVIAFLPAIPPGLDRDAFMTRLEAAIETASDALAAGRE
jgi:1-acyl-sn-glycerol-3-phosphate acyltransferase